MSHKLDSKSQTQFPLWVPKDSVNQLSKFMNELGYKSYEDLYNFSITNTEEFWAAIWDYCDIIGNKGNKPYLMQADRVKEAVFFPTSTLNYAQNLLENSPENAIIAWDEVNRHRTLNRNDLVQAVAKVASHLRSIGIKKGDCIAGYLPNIPETVIFMLATSSIGAVWSSCSPDFGVQGVVDRFGQIEPRVFITTDGYFYAGKTLSNQEKNRDIISKIPSIEHVIQINFAGLSQDHDYLSYTDILNNPVTNLVYEQLNFNDPLFIMYSSGTTGVPKCIVHGVGGTLIQHLKEHKLHCDINPGDKLFYFTTCGWMMWNWLVSGLASGATLILYDGNPAYPNPDSLFEMADKFGVTHFGTSAKYLDSLAKISSYPKEKYSLGSLKMILSTGSPLLPETFEYVYQSIKSDICLASISGGTDIISCFALGNPLRPVWSGELQCRGLGMKVEVFDDNGMSVVNQKGELVCTAPFPSRPIGFWNDPENKKYHEAYYNVYDNVWHHGDFVEITDHDGLIIYGRSDTVLNPGGVRIGTAEIYRQVDKISEIAESVVVGQEWNGDVRVVLFVKLKDSLALDDTLKQRIKQEIRINTTPRHVPAIIIQVTDIPKTKNGKIVESAVRKVIHGEEIKNSESLSNPEILNEYRNIPDLMV